MFKFDKSKIPDVRFRESWKLRDGENYEIYEADGWDFEYFEDERVDEIEHARRSAYAWIAWLNWLEAKNEK